MAKRHKWSRKNGWAVCQDCGVRYRTGNFTKEYELPDGSRISSAGQCTNPASWPGELPDDQKPFYVTLWPASWIVTCSSCKHENDVEHVVLNDHGHFIPADGDQFIRCEECNAFLAVRPVTLSEVAS